jgi:hypothetical protein
MNIAICLTATDLSSPTTATGTALHHFRHVLFGAFPLRLDVEQGRLS